MRRSGGRSGTENGKPTVDAFIEHVLALEHLAWAAKHAEKIMKPRRVGGSMMLANVTPILSTQDDPRLPLDTVDLVLMVDVYHELSQPQLMLRHIKASLKAGGRLVLLEYRKEDPNIPIRPEHKMSVAEAKLEVEAEGFRLTTTNEDLPRQHILIFTRQ